MEATCSPARGPGIGEGSRQEYMQGDAPVHGPGQGQNQEQKVGGIEQGGLKAAEEGGAREEMRIP